MLRSDCLRCSIFQSFPSWCVCTSQTLVCIHILKLTLLKNTVSCVFSFSCSNPFSRSIFQTVSWKCSNWLYHPPLMCSSLMWDYDFCVCLFCVFCVWVHVFHLLHYCWMMIFKMYRKRRMIKRYVVTVCMFFFPYLHDHLVGLWNRVICLQICVWLLHVLGCKFHRLELHLTSCSSFIILSLSSCSSALRLLILTSALSPLSSSRSNSNASWSLEPNETRPLFSHSTYL